MESVDALQDRGRCLRMCMRTRAFPAKGLEDGIDELDRG
jgi:hypothetical protein